MELVAQLTVEQPEILMECVVQHMVPQLVLSLHLDYALSEIPLIQYMERLLIGRNGFGIATQTVDQVILVLAMNEGGGILQIVLQTKST